MVRSLVERDERDHLTLVPHSTTFRFRAVMHKETSRFETKEKKNKQILKRKFSNCKEI
jgi:hypothetical protein